METIKENWKPVVGYEALYEVSNLGNIRNTAYWTRYHKIFKRKEPREVKQETTYDGYKRVHLSNKGELKGHAVHRLVAFAFIPNPNNLPQINHIDENPANNNVSNLQWCTGKENCNHGLHRQRIVEFQTNNPKRSVPVLQYDMKGNFIKEFPSTKEVERQLGIRSEQISRVCKGKNHHAGGFKWKYKNQ